MNLIDCHNHSLHSFDADFSVKEMFKSAVERSLYAFALTDHCEVNFYKEHNLDIEIPKSILEINSLKGTLGKTKLIAGIELGQPLQDTVRASEFLSTDGLDFVIASLHNAMGELDYYYFDFEKETNESIIDITNRYYEELYQMASSCDFDVLGHITYPFRYIHEGKRVNPNLCVPMSLYDEMIYETLKKLVQRGKGIEINTSGLRQTIHETMPNEKYIKMYNELGGEILSVGSDAHFPQHVGNGIIQGYEIAKSVGFSYVTYFENRKPVMLKIDE